MNFEFEDIADAELDKANILDDIIGYREFEIEKKNGKMRKICAPSAKLKAEQRKNLKSYYETYETMSKKLNIDHIVHGFVPGKNVVTAANRHIGFDSTTMLDIKDFFDNVTQSMIQSTNCTYFDSSFHADGYCAQGFVTSPILACIATAKMVANIDSKLNGYFKDYSFTMYADDIQVSINKPNKERIKKIVDIITHEVDSAGFKMNKKKTRTKFAKFGYRRILGVNVGDDEVRATRKTMRKIRAAKHGGNNSSLGGLMTWSKCKLPNKKRLKISKGIKPNIRD